MWTEEESFAQMNRHECQPTLPDRCGHCDCTVRFGDGSDLIEDEEGYRTLCAVCLEKL